ncbi:MAG: hypothetical protein H6720_13350 [Sandaracinus sp.]|nr:hypothetical protein [Sandaracinus sp.]
MIRALALLFAALCALGPVVTAAQPSAAEPSANATDAPTSEVAPAGQQADQESTATGSVQGAAEAQPPSADEGAPERRRGRA